VNYYGPVATYLLDMEALQEQLRARNPDHLAWLTTRDALAVDGSMPPRIQSPETNAPSSPIQHLPWREQSRQAAAMH
jgi:hypothetical protein